MRDESKCVLKGDGELYLMMDGQYWMLRLYVDNWDTTHMVNCCMFNDEVMGVELPSMFASSIILYKFHWIFFLQD